MNITEPKKTKQEVLQLKNELAQRSEDRYHALYNAIDEGFCILEVLYDEEGQPFDFRYLDVNPAFEKQTGVISPVGKTFRDVMPSADITLIIQYAKVVHSNEPLRFVFQVPSTGRWYNAYAARVGKPEEHQITVLFNDIIDRKRRELNTAFLSEVRDDMNRLGSVKDIVETVGEKLGRFIDVTIVCIVDIDEEKDEARFIYIWNNGIFPVRPIVVRLSEYLTDEFVKTMRQGEQFIINDTQNDPRTHAKTYAAIGLYSGVVTPFHRDGKWKYMFGITDVKPHSWRDDELELLRELANSFFPRLEKARAEEALRQSEERFRLFVTASSDLVYRMNADWSRMEDLVGKEFLADTDHPTTNWIRQYILPEDQPHILTAIQEAIHTKSIFELEHRVIRADGALGWAYSRAVPVLNEQGEIVEWFGTASDVTERVRAEESLRESEEKYRTLFNSLDEGFCIVEVLFDENEKPIDYRFLEVNSSFERQTGIENGVGRTMREIAPEHEEHWFETYGRVALTGEPVRFESRAVQLHRWYDVYAFRVDKPGLRRVAILFKDITERKQMEETLRTSEERQTFLLKLSDALRPLRDPAAIQDDATRVLGEHLGVSRVLYGEVSEDGAHLIVERNYVAHDAPVLTGRFRMADFGPTLVAALRAGHTITIPDITSATELSAAERAAHTDLGIVALLGVPLMKGGRFVANLNVHHSRPRAWTAEEIALIQETAERTWAAVERAHAEEALRESEAQIQKALSIETVGVLFFQLDGHITDVNEAFLRMSGYSREELLGLEDWGTLTPPEFMAVTSKAAKELAETGETAPYEKQMLNKAGWRWWGLFAPTRLSGDGLESQCVEFVIDITERKQTEQVLHEQQAMLQSFYDSAPFLMGIAELDGDQIVAISGNRAAAEFFATDPLALPGKTGTELGNSEDFERLWIENYRRSQGHGKPVQFDYEHLRFGNSRWLRATVAFLGMRPSGKPRFSFVVEDITDQKRAELSLHEKQKQLQLLNETLEQKVQEKTVEVRRLASDLIKATQRERQRISHVLHDDLQQRIYAIQMQLSFLREELQDENGTAQRDVADIEKELGDILKITRHLSIDLSPPILQGEGLSHAIEWLAGRMRQQYGLPIELQAHGSYVIPSEELHVLLFNCVRELLFNAAKHAEASRVVVALEWIDDNLRIEVRDDGKGFLVKASEEPSAGTGLLPSLGLPTIRHQLSLFGGHMEIDSKPGDGTKIILTVPVRDERQDMSSEHNHWRKPSGG